MEKIIQCKPPKQRDTKFFKSKRNQKERMVLAEGLDPIETIGNKTICNKLIHSRRNNFVMPLLNSYQF